MSSSKSTHTHGGERPGAGRRTGTGVYGEPTRLMRIPESQLGTVKSLLHAHQHRHAADEVTISDIRSLADVAARQTFPLVGARVAAGFTSPAVDYIEANIDLNEYLVLHKEATFFVRANGFSMIKEGINDKDILMVDRAINPAHDHIVIACVNNDMTVKKLYKQRSVISLLSGNPEYPPIKLRDGDELVIWGVVTTGIRRFKI